MVTPSNKHRARQQRGGVAAIVLNGILVLGGFVLLGAGLSADRPYAEADRVFRAAPLCVEGTKYSSACRLNAPMLVTGKWVVYHRNHKHDYLELKARSGETYRLDFGRANELWAVVSIGQIVETQSWQDEVITLTAGGMTYDTDFYPVARPRQMSLSYGGLAGFVLGVFILFFIFSIISAIKAKPDGFSR